MPWPLQDTLQEQGKIIANYEEADQIPWKEAENSFHGLLKTTCLRHCLCGWNSLSHREIRIHLSSHKLLSYRLYPLRPMACVRGGGGVEGVGVGCEQIFQLLPKPSRTCSFTHWTLLPHRPASSILPTLLDTACAELAHPSGFHSLGQDRPVTCPDSIQVQFLLPCRACRSPRLCCLLRFPKTRASTWRLDPVKCSHNL